MLLVTASSAVQREYKVPLHPLQGHLGPTDPPCVLRGGREEEESEKRGREGERERERERERESGKEKNEKMKRGREKGEGRYRWGVEESR